MWREACRVLSAEWLRVRKSRATLAGLVTYIAVVLILYLTYYLAVRRSFMGIPTGFYLSGAVLSAAVTPLAFVGVLLVAFSMGREFSSGTISLVWARSLTRRGWLAGKVLGSVVHLKVFFVLALVLILAAAGMQLGFSSLMEKDYLIHSAGSLWWSLILAAALTWVALVAAVIFVSVPALYIASPGGTIAVSVVAGFILQLAAGWDALKPFLLSTYLSAPLAQFVAMSKGLPMTEEWGSLTRTCLLGSLIWMLAGWFWAVWIVNRKEVLS
jgi:ABC-type transport system involved in multi-copper enzyme maturation permease subunit